MIDKIIIKHDRGDSEAKPQLPRFQIFRLVMLAAFLLIMGKLFFLQVVMSSWYTALASNQHDLFAELFPDRGTIYVKDKISSTGKFPIAVNKQTGTVVANPLLVVDPKIISANLAPLLKIPPEELEAKVSNKKLKYVVLAKNVADTTVKQILALKMKGLDVELALTRFYPDANLFSHLTGFVGADSAGRKLGRYGLEGFLNKTLYGQPGFLVAERDPLGRLIGTAARNVREAVDGADVTLTVDRAIQYVACSKLKTAVKKTQAVTGSVVILEPKTGAILAMCNYPDFDPNNYGSVDDIAVFNNLAVWGAYEPGSVFKPVVMAAALDAGLVAPSTTFVDRGSVTIGPDTIKNANNKIYGLQTMTQVLENSVNTGMVFVSKLMGNKLMGSYLDKFGFGLRSGVEIDSESSGNIKSLTKPGSIWAATASFGQGVTATPLQLAAAYATIANGGIYMKPYIVGETKYSDGRSVLAAPQAIRGVISERSALQTTGMLISVVERGHGKRAGVKGYYVAGKTGTAEVPRTDGRGYQKDAAVGSFAGFAPAYKPVFAMSVKLDRPKGVTWAESTAAPLFGDIASFLLQYYQVPPER